ncbi:MULTISPECIES: hypothetical protein [unclassified Corynebacterium]|uniref:hypothetical protein n=1 Tax=unclassified Corynebacterium TaxID=2624378 RepID=UPI0029CA1B4D|nr:MULTISPECIES: hypothetical protein [unclassified Corynebacterium]WPF65582.1 hypothetical protein OLX12_08360 [Corynebacterium sp. 22KM0430]WPF68077.1 hypothetical protein OLW90_08350 [Corynebacterium sp. 21KM1197]
MSKSSTAHDLATLCKKLLPGSKVPPLQAGLDRISSRLGFCDAPTAATQHHHSTINVATTASKARSIYYAPDMDGQPEPGEVVRVWAPSDGPDRPLRDRAVLVIGHGRDSVLGLLISPNPRHANESEWLDIGSGEWDEKGRQCWVRLDRVLEVSHLGIRRQGVLFPRRRFERIAAKLRNRYGWT